MEGSGGLDNTLLVMPGTHVSIGDGRGDDSSGGGGGD